MRKLYGFPVEATVACGDSGNDILMLNGSNPAIVVSWRNRVRIMHPLLSTHNYYLSAIRSEADTIIQFISQVGNAQPDLLKWVEQQRRVEPPSNNPNDKERLFLAAKHEALGILEGLQRLGYA